MTPYHHREITALVAQAWSTLEETNNERGRRDAAALLRKALACLDGETPAESQGELSVGRGVATPIESNRSEWWPTVSRAAEALGVRGPSVSSALRNINSMCAGRKLWRSKHRTREEFQAATQRAAVA
jgi:hypothetical protein